MAISFYFDDFKAPPASTLQIVPGHNETYLFTDMWIMSINTGENT